MVRILDGISDSNLGRDPCKVFVYMDYIVSNLNFSYEKKCFIPECETCSGLLHNKSSMVEIERIEKYYLFKTGARMYLMHVSLKDIN